MLSEAIWINPWVLASGGAVVLGVVLLAKSLSTRERYELRRLHCPETGKEVEALLVRDLENGRFRAVDRCSAFRNTRHVECGRCCLELLNRGFRLAGNDLP